MLELLNRRIQEETDSGCKQTCYLMVTHGVFVDETANVFDFLSNDTSKTPIPPTAFSCLTPEQRQKLLDFIQVEHFAYYATPYG